MMGWQQFFLVAGAHFLALLSPGPDFFLVLRSALRQGRRQANAVCVGIALANGVYIALAVTGVALLQPRSAAFEALRWGGCAYLAWLGWACVRAAGETVEIKPANLPLPAADRSTALVGGLRPAQGRVAGARERWFRERSDWLAAFSSGFLSGLLNPKNALFYASLFAFVGAESADAAVLFGYGVWMFSVVLGWDMFVARMAGHPAVVGRMAAHAGRFSLATGAVFFVLAALLAWGG